MERSITSEYIQYSDKWFLLKYFEYGSVDAALSSGESMPISEASYYRLVSSHGLVPSAGRQVSFPEALHFFKEKALSKNLPLSQIYKKMPISFKTSVATLHRIYRSVEESVVRRNACALLLYTDDAPHSYLFGREVTGNNRYKNIGNWTIPMSFAKENEPFVDSVFRVLQNEVSIMCSLDRTLSTEGDYYCDLKDIQPNYKISILDTCVSVFTIKLPQAIVSRIGSYKLSNLQFIDCNEINLIDEGEFRPGVLDVINGSKGVNTSFISALNIALLTS